MSDLSRRRDTSRKEKTRLIFLEDVHSGTIGRRAGVPTDVEQWGWRAGRRERYEGSGFVHLEPAALDNDWDGIYLGRRKGGDLIYAGKVDHGFDKQSSAELRDRLTPLIRKTQPYTKRIAHKSSWVEPELLAEIEYRAKSAEGKVRHPFFKGLREDL